MSFYTNSPNMSLPIPTVGLEPGPDYAIDINAALLLVDQHDHTSGNGVQITTQAININADLTLNSNALTYVKSITLVPDEATPAINMIYEDGVDLYFMDGDGNAVRLTQSGAVAGTPGSISNLVAPASASYVGASSKFVWESDTSVAADMDFGSAIMRNTTPNSTFALTLAPPAGLASNYQIVLPTLPASQKIVTLDNSGNMSAPYSIDTNTLAITANVIGIKDLGVNTAQLAADAVTTVKILDLNVTADKLAGSIPASKLAFSPSLTRVATFTAAAQTYVVPSTIVGRIVAITGCGGGGGGGSGSSANPANNTTGGGGGAGGQVGTAYRPITFGDTITMTQLGAGGTGGAAVAGVSNGNAGNNGTATIITCSGVNSWTVTFYGGMGGPGGTSSSYTNSNKTFFGGTSSSQGGDCTTGVFGSPTAGYSSAYAVGGAAGAVGPSGTGGTGGGAAIGTGGTGGNGVPSVGGTAGANTGGGGGGGGGGTGGVSAAGGVGGTGIAYVDLVPLA
jgi:hypothetical protein